MRWNVAACFGLIAACAMSTGATAGEPPKGKLAKVSKQVGQLLKLTLDGGKLVLDRAHWDATPDVKPPDVVNPVNPGVGIFAVVNPNQSPAQKVFDKLRVAAGSRSCFASAIGNRRTSSFSGCGLNAKLDVNGPVVQVTIREEAKPFNELDVTDSGDGSLRIVHNNGAGDIFVLVQSRTGRVSIVQVVGDKTLGKRAASFAALYRDNRKYVDGRLFPYLKRLGVRLFPGRFDPEVIRVVLSRLRPLTDAERAEFKALLTKMDDPDFDTRERATKALSKRFARFSEQISAALAKPPSEEVKLRLENVVTENAGTQGIQAVIAGLGLLDDRAYLEALRDKTKGPDRQAVVNRLAQLARKKPH